jgi:hypothetical protein
LGFQPDLLPWIISNPASTVSSQREADDRMDVRLFDLSGVPSLDETDQSRVREAFRQLYT